ncbi:Hypp7253 [Branchiostoma lanceolatum]|uniref:Hypp7253 protein n=1 Tax=Branchiostoma lanceolatum TaxID=7740 RepID=A0A8J9YZ97_BRALA|nr:Hypp7253 [Branchiostoma lanceolatum]
MCFQDTKRMLGRHIQWLLCASVLVNMLLLLFVMFHQPEEGVSALPGHHPINPDQMDKSRALADRAEHQQNTSRPISDPPSRAECFEIFKTFAWRSRTPADSAERQPTRPNANRASSRITPESLQPWSGESREAMFGYV